MQKIVVGDKTFEMITSYTGSVLNKNRIESMPLVEIGTITVEDSEELKKILEKYETGKVFVIRKDDELVICKR